MDDGFIPSSNDGFVPSAPAASPPAPEKNYAQMGLDLGRSVLKAINPVAELALTNPSVRKAIADNTIGPGVIDQMYSAKKSIQESVSKYPATSLEGAIDLQDDLNKKLATLPDLGPGDPSVSAKYAGAPKDSLVPNAKATMQAAWDFSTEKHGALQQLANPFLIPEQFAVRETVAGLNALGKMPSEDAKKILSQNQLFWSDLVNYYWKDPSNMAMRATRLLAGQAANIIFDPAAAISGIGKLTDKFKQVQVLGKTMDMSKAADSEIAVAKTASRIGDIINTGDHVSLDNVEAVRDFSQGKIGFSDLTKTLDLPKEVMDDVHIAGRELGQQDTYMQGLADRTRAPHFGLRIPFTNMAIEYSPGFATDITQIAGKGAIASMGLATNISQYLGDSLPGFFGAAYMGASNGVKGAMTALRQMKTKTGVAPFDATVNWLRGDNADIINKSNQMVQKAQGLIGAATPEQIAGIINVIEHENKEIDPILNAFPKHDPNELGQKLIAGNEKAKAIRSSFPPEVSDSLNEYIDMHQKINENALSMQEAQGLPVERLDPLKSPNSPTAYIAHVVTQKLKDMKSWARETIGISDAATDARLGKTIDRSTYGREDTRTISEANRVNQEAMGVDKFVNNPAELMLHTYVNSRQSVQKNILLKSALDTSVQYSKFDIMEAGKLEHQYHQASELAAAGDLDSAAQLGEIGPRLQQLQEKMRVPEGWVKVDPDHWKEMVDIVGEDGRVVEGANGKPKIEAKAHMFVPQEFVQEDHHVWMHPQVYSQIKEIANPFRTMSAADLVFDRVGRLTNSVKSIYISRPGTTGVISLSKLSEYLINGQNNPLRSLSTAIQMWEPPAPIKSMIERFGTFDKTLADEKPILHLPDGTSYSKQELHDLLTKYNVIGSSIAQPVQWEGVLNQLSSARKFNQEMGTVPKTALEMGTLFRTMQYMVKTTDDFFKTATFSDKLMSGFTAQAAADAVERQYFNFNNTNRTGANAVLKPLAIFTAHPIKALESAVWKMAQGPVAQLSIPWKVNHTLQGAYIQDPTERAALSQQIPMYDQIKEPILGPFMPGGREMMVDPSFSNQTLSLFLDPKKNLNPLLSTLFTGLASKSRTRFDGDVDQNQFITAAKEQFAQLMPYPVKLAFSIAEANGVIDTSSFGRGGLFGDIEKPPVSNSPNAHMHFNDSLEFGRYVQSQLGDNPIYNKFFRPLDGDTLKEEEMLIARGNMMASVFRDATLGQAYIRNMDNASHQVDSRLTENAKHLHTLLKESYQETGAQEEQALKERWSEITTGQRQLEPIDRDFLIHMGAMNRKYGELSEQMLKDISARGLLPDATAIEDWQKLKQISTQNPIAAQMVATKQQQVALHSIYSWILDAQREAQEKTGVPGYNPFKLLFGLEHVDFSPEAKDSLDEVTGEVGPFLNKDKNQEKILNKMNYETLHE